MALLQELASQIGGVIVGVLLKVLYDLFSRVKPLGLLLGDVRNNYSDCFILLGSYQTIRPTTQPSKPRFLAQSFRGPVRIYGPLNNLEVGAAQSMAFVHVLLAAAKKTERIVTKLAHDDPTSVAGHNNIAISGPGSNYRVGQVFDKYQRTFFKIAGNNNVIVSDDGQIQVPNTNVHDHGVLLKLENESDPNKVVFVLAGLGEDATAAAGYALWHFRRKLVRQFGRKPFGCVIQVDTREGYQSAKIIHSAPTLQWWKEPGRWIISLFMK